MTCCVCRKPIQGEYRYHLRLDVYVCGTCPLTNVRGEDVSGHCLKHGTNDDQFVHSVSFTTEDFFKVVNALRDKCGCHDCERISGSMLDQFAFSKRKERV